MNGLHNKNTELHNNSGEKGEKVTSIQDQKADEIDEILSDLEDYHRGYAKGIMPHEAKQQLLALKERWEREARIDESRLQHKKYDDGDGCAFCEGDAYSAEHDAIIIRIAQLGGKE